MRTFRIAWIAGVLAYLFTAFALSSSGCCATYKADLDAWRAKARDRALVLEEEAAKAAAAVKTHLDLARPPEGSTPAAWERAKAGTNGRLSELEKAAGDLVETLTPADE